MNFSNMFLTSSIFFASICGATAAHADSPTQATRIPMTAVDGQLADLLGQAGPLVKKTEPKTTAWFGLRSHDAAKRNHVAIVDFFTDETGRAAHFGGQVAGLLKQKAPTIVKDAWNDGVLKHVENSTVLSHVRRGNVSDSKLAVAIAFKALPGKEKAVEAFLVNAAKTVESTEPGTLFWVSLKVAEGTYVIFDTFADGAGADAHFAGKVAAALKNGGADQLLQGGWANGVLANVEKFEVLSHNF
ncbi:MAG: putative quinol monooxygenase [Bradymonadia bacterium]